MIKSSHLLLLLPPFVYVKWVLKLDHLLGDLNSYTLVIFSSFLYILFSTDNKTKVYKNFCVSLVHTYLLLPFVSISYI